MARKNPQRWSVLGQKAITYIVRRNGNRHKVIVSADDAPSVSQYRWHICGKGYAWTCQISKKSVSMHSLVMGCRGIDHVNHNPLDNRRENLRSAKHNQNLRNKMPNKNARVRFKGVTKRRHTKKNPYVAKICCNGVQHRIGKFNNPRDAAVAYDKKALELHGDYALTNKMLGLL